MSDFAGRPWFIWSMAIVVLFPLLAALLGQWLGGLERRGSPLARSMRHVVNVLLPVAAFFLILRFVAEAPPEGTSNRVVLTLVLVLAIYASVSIFNAVFFGAAPSDSWRGRTPRLLRDIILSIFVAIGGAIVLAQVWDQDVTAILTALGVGSVILGFALQETLGNVMLGLSLLMERPYAEGDEIGIGEVEGLVEEINWRATRIEVDGDIVIVPHSVAAGETITNFSRPALETPVALDVGFAYEHPPNQVRAMLREVIEAADGARIDDTKPELGVFVTEFGDSSINYTISFLARSAETKERVIDNVMTLVWYGAQRGGFNIPFPIRTLHHLRPNDGTAEMATQAVATLAESSFTNGSIEAADLDRWVRGARLRHYSNGETVVQQGTQSAELGVIAAGEALLRVRMSGGAVHDLYKLGRGDFFGEGTLLSGIDSPYLVEARSDLEVLALPAEDVRRLIEKKPSLAIEIGQIMDMRRQAMLKAGKDRRSDRVKMAGAE